MNLSVYDPVAALVALNEHKIFVFICLGLGAGLSFVYFTIALRMTKQQQLYCVPFSAASWFFWHDLSYVLHYPLWIETYHSHWYLMLWTYAQVGTVAFEAFLIWQFIHYGRKELMPDASPSFFAGLVVLATLGVGALWWLVKTMLADELYLIAQNITLAWPSLFQTGILLRRKSRAGSSIIMQICVMIMLAALSAVGMLASPFFLSPAYLTFFAVFMIWPLVNIALILRCPPYQARASV